MTKLKSRLGAFLAVTALSGAILAGFTACPLDSASEAAGAVGYGQVTIDCGDAAESVDRSVFPGKTGLTYEYAFTKSGGSPQTITPENGAFTLEYGEWTVEVKAYAGSDQSVSNLAATGTKSFTVNAASLTVAVELTGVSDTGNGTFKYKIQYPAGVTITSFTMKKLPNLTSSVTLSYTPATIGGITEISETKNNVVAGFYLVTITAEKNGGSSGRNEIVHIYNGLTSEFGTDAAPIVFSAADFTAIPLTANLWADGNLSANGTQWFSFTATAATQYINVNFGTLTDLYVQLYDNAGVAVGTETNLYGSTRSISRTVTPGAVYYVKVRPYSGSGAYKVAFSTTAAVTLPSTGVTVLAYQNFWSNGSIPASNGTQWFRFTATAATQYIHVNFGTLDDLYVQLYDDAGLAVGTETNLYSGIRNISRTVTTGSVYYVKVRPYSTYTGTYWIGFNASSSGIPSLIENTLKSGNIPTAGGTQWFSFTATAATQYIHVTFNTLTDLYVQLYDSTGATVGAESNLWSTTRYISRTVTPGNVYYIKVRPYSTYTGTYSIGFNASSTAPSP